MTDKLSKVDKIKLMLEAAQAEEGQLDDFKKYSRDKLLTGAWIIDKQAVFGLVPGDKICVINDAGDVWAAAVTEVAVVDMLDGEGVDDEGESLESVYLAATIEWIDVDGDPCSGYIASYDDTVYVKILK